MQLVEEVCLPGIQLIYFFFLLH